MCAFLQRSLLQRYVALLVDIHCGDIGLFFEDIGLFCGDIGLAFVRHTRLTVSPRAQYGRTGMLLHDAVRQQDTSLALVQVLLKAYSEDVQRCEKITCHGQVCAQN